MESEHRFKSGSVLIARENSWGGVGLHIMASTIWNHEVHEAVGASLNLSLTPKEARDLAEVLDALADRIERPRPKPETFDLKAFAVENARAEFTKETP